jgi:hypothetical protein
LCVGYEKNIVQTSAVLLNQEVIPRRTSRN